ncbi:hypothetical protein IWX48DRAFT_223500 [Phyllosticta citricarpa]
MYVRTYGVRMPRMRWGGVVAEVRGTGVEDENNDDEDDEGLLRRRRRRCRRCRLRRYMHGCFCVVIRAAAQCPPPLALYPRLSVYYLFASFYSLICRAAVLPCCPALPFKPQHCALYTPTPTTINATAAAAAVAAAAATTAACTLRLLPT